MLMKYLLDGISYNTAVLKVKDDEGKKHSVVIRSSASHEVAMARAESANFIEAANAQGVELTKKVKRHGVETEEITEAGAYARAIIYASMVVEWPFDEDLIERIVKEYTEDRCGRTAAAIMEMSLEADKIMGKPKDS